MTHTALCRRHGSPGRLRDTTCSDQRTHLCGAGHRVPAYPVGTDLESGVAVLKAIPVAVLFTTEPVPLDPTGVCAGVPADVVTPAGFAATPVSDSEFGCVWHGLGLALEIGVLPYSMA